MNHTTTSTKTESVTTRIPPNPSGLCGCGCGQTTNKAPHNDPKKNWVKGEHLSYIHNHHTVITIPPEERFWTFVDKSGDCWNWTALKNDQGYGKFVIRNKQIFAHRFSYQLANGVIPEGLFVCHHCDNPSCVRPSHLFVGTIQDNTADCVAKGRNSKGEKHTSAKLTENDVRQIRSEYASGVSGVSLAKRYKICTPTISNIIHRKSWKHIE